MIENDSISVILLSPYRCRFSLSFIGKKTAKEALVMTPVSSTLFSINEPMAFREFPGSVKSKSFSGLVV
ncbi:hypothetical protein BB552_14955 [Escherichia coli]|uniref:Uncharacterized protein n=1 Tax=Escherichia coli TaxID=562 RepID=A0A2A2BXG9_ECOLX|nr:hypothetical protein [Escherichia coli]EIN65165.1 hypothetical protein ECPA10_6200 [Escherichia coli PA10]EIP60166.1 hypothetical protein ECEC1738_2839 [Escherichia coli EC1738]EKK32984.1 hypothetical protein EC52239_1544 [Escherichia coli 5.2239]EKW33502.1 hypothetical protein EC950943_1494 [Escherichia coli 95.0943]ELV27730.1 hypothetical protein EC09BKT78844_1174 [Escherichia coli 09BKT078844]ERC99641.1 hypothetical protein S1I_2907 [Escherichia coli B103]ERD66895.1 hypothetical protei